MRAMLGAAALSIVLTGSAVAQLPAPTFSLQQEKHKTQAEIEHDQAIDKAYRSATQKIPDRTTPNDPWATVRTAPAAPAMPPKKKLQAAQGKKQQLSEGAKKPGE
jgi:hypothetical protein